MSKPVAPAIDLVDNLAKATELIDDLLDLLDEDEWYGEYHHGMCGDIDWEVRCLHCGELEEDGHDTSCELVKLRERANAFG